MEKEILHFSRRKFYKTIPKYEIEMYQDVDKKYAKGSWVKQCDGKTEEECHTLGFHIERKWMSNYKRKVRS